MLRTISMITSLSMSTSVSCCSKVLDFPVLIAEMSEKKADSRVFLASMSCSSSVDLMLWEPIEDFDFEIP